MAQKLRHRGPDPEDERAFSPAALPVLALESAFAQTGQIVATADRVILDRCQHWFNLAREVIDTCIPTAKVIDLSLESANS